MSPYATMSLNVDIAAAQGSIQKRSCLKWVNCKNSCYCAQWAKLLEEESEVEAKAWGQCRPSFARYRLATLRVFKSINRFQAPNVRNAEQKLQTCLDRVDSQGWLGVVWVLAGLIELRLRHLGRFDFHKANIRLWIPSSQVGLGFRSSRVKLMEYCHVQSWRAVSQLEVSRFEPGAFRSWFFPSHVSGLGVIEIYMLALAWRWIWWAPAIVSVLISEYWAQNRGQIHDMECQKSRCHFFVFARFNYIFSVFMSGSS